MEMRYIKSDRKYAQGKRNEIYRQYGSEWTIRERGGGCGNWSLTKKSDVIVNEKSYRDFILNYYGKAKLTQNLFEKFKTDVENGKINLEKDTEKNQ